MTTRLFYFRVVVIKILRAYTNAYKLSNINFNMARPRRFRKIISNPNSDYFKPRGIPMRDLEEVTLEMDEFEALNLSDLQGLEQGECAKRMHISQPTFHRTIISARKKVADAIINGKAIKILK